MTADAIHAMRPAIDRALGAEPDTVRVPARATPLAGLAAALLFVGLAVGYATTWDHQHDEGLTFDVALGSLPLAPWPAEPVPISALYAQLDGGEGAGDADAVLAALHDGERMPHPPAYYLLFNAWARLVGTDRLAVRVPAWLLGLLSIAGMGLLGRRLVPARWGAAAAMLLFAVAPWLHSIVAFARPYGLALCVMIWATLCVLEGASPGARARWRVAFVLLSVLGLYTVYHYMFVVAWHGVVMALIVWRGAPGAPAGGGGAGSRRRGLLSVAGLGALVAVGFAPWVPRLLAHLGVHTEAYFGGRVPLAFAPLAVADVLTCFALGHAREADAGGVLEGIFAVLGVCTAVIAVRFAVRLARGRAGAGLDRPARVVWGAMPLLPLLIAVADAWRDTCTLFVTKYAFALFPLLVLLAAAAWLDATDRRVRTGGLGALVVLLLAASVLHVRSRAEHVSHADLVAGQLAQWDRPWHVLVLSNARQGHVVPLLLTLREAGIRQVRVGLATRDVLDEAVDGLLAAPGVRRVTLANLYARKWTRTDTWTDKHMLRMLRKATEAGWGVRSGPIGEEQEATGPTGRVMATISPVQGRAFAMVEWPTWFDRHAGDDAEEGAGDEAAEGAGD